MSRRNPPAAERQLEKAAEQIQSQLKSAVQTTEFDALASYYTLSEPLVRGMPFCVALARSTFLFHLQMERVSESDAELYVSLISKVCSLISSPSHPFLSVVLKEDLLGLLPNGHAVVLLPVQQYNAWSHVVAELTIRSCISSTLSNAWRSRLDFFATSRSPLVSLRSQMLLVKISSFNDNPQDLAELQRVIQSRPTKMNVDLLLLCYERLQRLVPDAVQGSAHGRALSILSSDIFLKLRSPIRRHYVEHYLYPSLASEDTSHFLDNESTRRHMSSLLLRQCTPGMQPGTPYYMCLCAIIQKDLVEELDGAMELVSLMEYQMPHAAYFISALAIDHHMAQSVFIKILMLLNRGAAHVMAQRDPSADPIAAVVNNRTTMVYNILFTLRDIARQCVTTDSKRSSELLAELRTAVSPATVRALGTFASQAFEGRCDISIEPQLLCAELGMLLHSTGVDDAVDTCIAYFQNAASLCSFCGCAKGSSLMCHVNGGIHLSDRASLSRVLSTVSDCAGTRPVQDKLIALLRSPSTQLLPATHFLIYHILTHAGQHRAQLLANLEPHLRAMLVSIADADASNAISSDLRTSVLMLHSRLVNLFPQDPLQLQSMLRIFSGLTVRCEHDALALFWVCHKLMRVGKANVELLPIDPQETHYGQDVPGTAPSSYAAADNAQLLMHILSTAHAFNGATRKLLGCSVCKLIQDFNVQSPNIISSLADPIGIVPNTQASAATFGFPCSPENNFWHFVIRQMRKSAPARTAFVTSFTRCVASRFRSETPANAVTAQSLDPSSHLFAVAFFSCLRRSAQMARIVSYMLSGWLGLRGHTPGKFVCLLYMCCQLTHALVSSQVDDVPLTAGERTLIDESILECVGAISKALPEASQLLLIVHDNSSFQHLLRRVIFSARHLTNSPPTAADSEWAPLPVDDAVFTNEIGAAFEEESVALNLAQEGPPVTLTALAVDGDDDLFGYENDGPDDYDDDEERSFVPSRDVPSSSSSKAMSRSASTYATATNPTLDTLMASSQTASSVNMAAVNHKANTIIHGTLAMDPHPLVEMPFPHTATKDGESQTSPNALSDDAPRLPTLQAHAPNNSAFSVPSDVVFEYLMTHQSRVSTLEDLQQLQFADANAYATPRDDRSMAAAALRVHVPQSTNAYNQPHSVQVDVSTLGGGAVTHLVPIEVLSERRANNNNKPSASKKRDRGADDMATPHQPIGSPWGQGIDSARNELRSVMAELGMMGENEQPRSMPAHPPPTFTPSMYPHSYEHHQQLSRSMRPPTAEGLPYPNVASGSMPTATRGGMASPSHGMAYVPPHPLAHGFVEQHSDTALREVRQAMGTANPNTAHTFSGRSKKEPLSSNATYTIHARQAVASDYYSVL